MRPILPLCLALCLLSACSEKPPDVLRNEAYDAALESLKDGDAEKALEHIDQAITLDAGAAHLHQIRGSILVHLNRYDQAVDAYDQAYRYNPKSAEAALGAGFALKMQGRDAEAENRFTLAERHYARRVDNPPDPNKSEEFNETAQIDAKLHLALIAALRGEKDAALLQVDRIAEKHPKYFTDADRWRDIIAAEGFEMIFRGEI